jgi:hypothetical protein
VNNPSLPVFQNSSLVTPRSVGYSYLPGTTLASVNPPNQISTFGTKTSPVPASPRVLPILTEPNPAPIGLAPIANPVRGVPKTPFAGGQPVFGGVSGAPARNTGVTLRSIGTSLNAPVAQPIISRAFNGLFA